MSKATRGNAAEAAILSQLVGRGYAVLVPFGSGQSYDLVIDLGAPGFLRVQCKTAWPRGGCLLFNSRTTDHGRGRQSYLGVADVFGVHFPSLDAVYLVPVDTEARFRGHLRLEPPRNNQRQGVRFAAHFEIDRWTREALESLVPERTGPGAVVLSPG